MSNLPPSGEIPRGAIRFNTDSNKPELWDGSQWAEFQLSTPNLAESGDVSIGARGFAAGGGPSSSNMITAVNLASAGRSFDFANLTNVIRTSGCGSSNTRAIAGGGTDPSGRTNVINIWTMASQADATDFGDLVDTVRSTTGVSNSVRVTFAGGLDDPTLHNDIQTVLFASQGGTIDFGALTNARSHTSGIANSVRAVIAGGEEPSKVSTMDVFNLATGNDAQEFGDLSSTRSSITPTGDTTRGVFMGGEPGFTNIIEYVTFSTTGNATGFGDLSSRAKRAGGSSSNCVRGFYFGGSNDSPSSNTTYNDCDAIIIQEQSNSVDFGDLHTTTHGFASNGVISNGHGGL
jgi:hypothetical protein